MDIINFDNSFIQFCADQEEGCSDFYNARLPIRYSSDVNFMLIIDDSTDTETDDMSFVYTERNVEPADTLAASDIITTISHEKTELEAGKFLFMTINCYTPTAFSGSAYAPDAGDCLYLVLIATSTGRVICKASVVFTYITNSCFTNVVRYRCADNAYDFYYEEANTYLATIGTNVFYNTVRLYLTIDKPLPMRNKKGFRLSDGAFLTLAADFRKEYSANTDYMNDFLHTRLLIALEHDYLYIFEMPIATGGEVTCANVDYSDYEYHHPEDDDYEIDWQDKPGTNLGVAPATFKLLKTPFYAQNTNCS